MRSPRLPVAASTLALVLVGGQAHAALSPQLGTWHAKQVRLSAAAQSAGRSGQGVLVAVIDTWVDGRHPSFGGRVLAGVDCVDGCSGAVQRDSCIHGTHVAGTVASTEYGVAPQARVLPLRILKWDGEQCSGNTDDAAAAIRYAVQRGAKVINLSVGGDTPLIGAATALPGAVSEAAAAGAVVVFAAGNDSAAVSDTYGNNALVVAATNNRGALASYSRSGAFVNVAAPGGDATQGDTCRADGADCVASTAPDGEYFAMAGTSMAAPHVAGLAALLIAQNPGRSRASVVARIKDTARPLAGAGDGLVDVTAALGVRATAAPKPTPTATKSAPATSQPVRPATRRPATSATVPAPSASAAASAAPTPTVSPSAEPVTSTTTDTAPPLDIASPDNDGTNRTAPIAAAAGLAAATALGVVSQWRRPRTR